MGYGYLLILSTWRWSLNFIRLYFLLFLYQCQQEYLSVEVLSGTFIFSARSRMKTITIHSGLFWAPSLKQDVDLEECSKIHCSFKDVREPSPMQWWFKGYLFSDTLELALLLLLRRIYHAESYKTSQYLESWCMRQGFLGSRCRLLRLFSGVRCESDDWYDSVLVQMICSVGFSSIVYCSILIV